MKRKLFIDIRSKENSIREAPHQINLNYRKVIRIPIKKISAILAVLLMVVSFAFNLFPRWPFGGRVFAPTSGDARAAQTQNSTEERKALEDQLVQLEKQIDEYDAKVQQYKTQGNTLQSEINKLNAKIAQLNLQIKAITLNIKKIDTEIVDTQSQITTTESKIDDKKKVIASILQGMYQSDDQNMVTIFLANYKISDFFNEMSRMASVQDKLRQNVEDLMGLHTQLSNQKETLALQKQDTVSLMQYQQAQKQTIQQTTQQKNDLLKVTKGKESEYKKILVQTQETAAQIRSRIFDLIGGGQISFGDAYKFAQFAESKTGVRAALILAVLDKESALGKNVGQCNYNINPYYPSRASNPTTMHPTRDIPIFLSLVKELGLNPDTLKVSCPIPSDGAYGGGMGPAQFLPSTWVKYSDSIASLTGDNPSSPWNNSDAFMATALYLKDAGASGGTLYAEKVAAAKYYAGSRWSSYMASYGASVIARANQFEQDIATLNA